MRGSCSAVASLRYELSGAAPPDAIVFVAPHPDDVAIAAGGLAAATCDRGARARMVLATDGSEARIPETVLRLNGWTLEMTPARTRALRGSIRVAEGREEARRLGLDGDEVILLEDQRWHSRHQTDPAAMFADLSLRDVVAFHPGPVDEAAVVEMQTAIAIEGDDVWVLTPHPADQLLMHRLVTRIVLEALLATGGRARPVFYEALSTTSFKPPGGAREVTLGFDEEVMARKRAAIRAHESMLERRRLFGGYSTAGITPYDELAHDRNRDLADRLGHALPFAERFALVDAKDGR